MNRLWFVTMVAVLVAAGGYYLYETNQPGSLVLRFVAFVDDESLVFNRVRYGNPGGVGEFEIRDFRFFLSNIRLVSGSETYSVPESYHLARFDGDTQVYQLELDNIPRRPYTEIQFGIGVDKAANSSIESVGDLDPNSRMAWAWDVGYKFILLEGGLLVNDVEALAALQSEDRNQSAAGSLAEGFDETLTSSPCLSRRIRRKLQGGSPQAGRATVWSTHGRPDVQGGRHESLQRHQHHRYVDFVQCKVR